MQDQTVPWCARKIYFSTRSYYLQGILNKINEQDTSFLDGNHKHMMKSGAPPDKVGSPAPSSMDSQAELILRVITVWFLVLSQFFRDGMGPFNIYLMYCLLLNRNSICPIKKTLYIRISKDNTDYTEFNVTLNDSELMAIQSQISWNLCFFHLT